MTDDTGPASSMAVALTTNSLSRDSDGISCNVLHDKPEQSYNGVNRGEKKEDHLNSAEGSVTNRHKYYYLDNDSTGMFR